MELTPKELEEILSGIANCGDRSEQPFRTDMLQNFATIQAILKSRYEGKIELEEMNNFKDEHKILSNKYSVGQLENGMPDYGDNKPIFDKKFTDLKISFEKTFRESIKIDREFDKTVMTKPIEISLVMLDVKDVPDDLNIGQYLGISKLIKPKD